MSIDLLDVNVWIAMSVQSHPHRTSALDYWNTQSAPSVVFTRTTMLGFLRIATYPKFDRPLTNAEAWAQYRAFLAAPGVTVRADPPTADAEFERLTSDGELPHRLWTDAWSAAFAIAVGARLVTFDRDFSRFDNLDLLLIEPGRASSPEPDREPHPEAGPDEDDTAARD